MAKYKYKIFSLLEETRMIPQLRAFIIVFCGFLCMSLFSVIILLLTPRTIITFPSPFLNRISHPRAFIIGVDGIGILPQTVDTPGIHRVINNGVHTFKAQTVHPSLSAESWTSLLHGVGPEKHNIYTSFSQLENSPELRKPNTSFPLTSAYPSIFRLMHEKNNTADMACFSNWKFIPDYIVEDGIGVFKYYTKSEKELIDKFEEYMETHDPWLVFFQLDDVDHAGHMYGFNSQKQKNQLMTTDKAVSRIIDIIEKNDMYHQDLIVIQTDHGGGGSFFEEANLPKPPFLCPACMHGSRDPIDMTIFWSARGRGICKSKEIARDVSIKDTAKFVASFLKLKIPETYDGADFYSELLCK